MTDNPGQVECWLCGKLYTPDPDKVKAWAESGRPFDGTDWECGLCDVDMTDDDGNGVEIEYEDEDSVEDVGWWHSDLSAGLEGESD